jgi:hypothetical protein
MRAATVIVGAIAISSCLIALALVLTKDSGISTQTVARPSAQKEKPRVNSDNAEVAPPPSSGPIQCNVEVTIEGASCFLGKNVLAVYEEGGGGASVTASDPESGEEVEFDCSGTAPTICTSRDGITVYLTPWQG